MASNESTHDQIMDALVESLGGIVGNGGADYHYTPAAVVAVGFFVDRALLNTTLATKDRPIYALRPGRELHREGQTGDVIGRVEVAMDVFVACLMPFTGSIEDDNPFKPDPLPRRRVVSRMVRDVLRKLLVDVRLLSVGGAMNNVFGAPVLVDRERAVEGWAVAEILFSVSYSYGGGTP